MKPIIKSDFARAIFSLGCFFGFCFCFPALCRLFLPECDTQMAESINSVFYFWQVIAMAVLIIALAVFDIENIISRFLIRALPGIIMAEALVAVCFSTVAVVKFFAAVGGIAAALGAAGALTALLAVRTRDRLKVIGISLAAGAGLYILCACVLPLVLDTAGDIISAALLAVLCGVFVRFEKFSGNRTGFINSIDKNTAVYIFKKLPTEYLIFIPVCVFYFVCFYISDEYISGEIIGKSSLFYVSAYLIFAAASVAVAFLIKPHNVAALLSSGAAVTASGIMVLSVTTLTQFELGMFAFFGYIGYALFYAGTLLLVTAFALDRLHPLFYAVVGYFCFALSRFASSEIVKGLSSQRTGAVTVAAVLFAVAAVSFFPMLYMLKRRGYTAEYIERRRKIRREISRMSKKYRLSSREALIIELLTVEKCPRDELGYTLFMSNESVERRILKIERLMCQSIDVTVNELCERYK